MHWGEVPVPTYNLHLYCMYQGGSDRCISMSFLCHQRPWVQKIPIYLLLWVFSRSITEVFYMVEHKTTFHVLFLFIMFSSIQMYFSPWALGNNTQINLMWILRITWVLKIMKEETNDVILSGNGCHRNIISPLLVAQIIVFGTQRKM